MVPRPLALLAAIAALACVPHAVSSLPDDDSRGPRILRVVAPISNLYQAVARRVPGPFAEAARTLALERAAGSVDSVSWTSPAGRVLLAGLGAVLRPLLARAAKELAYVEYNQNLAPREYSAAGFRARLDICNATLEGMDSLRGVSLEGDDKDHVNMTSAMGTLTSTAVVDAAVNFRGAGLESPTMRARFVVVCRLDGLKVTTRWHCPLRTQAARELIGGYRDGGEAPTPAAVGLKVTGARAAVGRARVSLQSKSPGRGADPEQAGFLWRLLNDVIADQLKEALEEEVAASVLEGIQEAEKAWAVALKTARGDGAGG